jgi:magnesium and cobalt transporter
MSTSREGVMTWLRKFVRDLAGAADDREALVDRMREAREQGLIDADALEMLEGVIEVADLQVRDIMIPRSQMVAVRRDDPADKLLPVVVESGHSRFPVMDDDRDDIVGILLAKDILRAFADESSSGFDIRECMRPVVVVPESKRVNVLLKEFRRNRNHMAIVVDEYGGVSGLVTIEDAIEQIVGDIDDEFDVEEDQDIRQEGGSGFLVRGGTAIEDFNEFFGTELSDEEFDTVAGLVMKQLGHMPRRGESVNIAGMQVRVMRADRRRVEMLKVTLTEGSIPPGLKESQEGP